MEKRAFIVSRIFSKHTYERYVTAVIDYLKGEMKNYKGDNIAMFLNERLIEAGFGNLPNDRKQIVKACMNASTTATSSSPNITWKEIERAFFNFKSPTSTPLREIIPKYYQKETAALHTPKAKRSGKTIKKN